MQPHVASCVAGCRRTLPDQSAAVHVSFLGVGSVDMGLLHQLPNPRALQQLMRDVRNSRAAQSAAAAPVAQQEKWPPVPAGTDKVSECGTRQRAHMWLACNGMWCAFTSKVFAASLYLVVISPASMCCCVCVTQTDLPGFAAAAAAAVPSAFTHLGCSLQGLQCLSCSLPVLQQWHAVQTAATKAL